MFQTVIQIFHNLTQRESFYQGLFLSIITITIISIVYRLATKGLRRHFLKRAQKYENAQNFLLVWRYIWLGLGMILVIISFSGSLATLGLSAAFVGMILGWSLQAPVTGLAAWIMIILKRPFKIGDRIIINNIIGDVVDITLTHVILNQVGGTIGGEEESGRIVLVPNGLLFQQLIFNYTLRSRYILDEVMIAITFNSDLDTAERILIDAATQTTAAIIEETKKGPYVRIEIFESGIRMRLRYRSIPRKRTQTASDISRTIIKKFTQQDNIAFAYPHMQVLRKTNS